MIFWTPEMIAALEELRMNNIPFFLCAEKLGVSYTPCVLKGRELGLASRRNRGRIPGLLMIEKTHARLPR